MASRGGAIDSSARGERRLVRRLRLPRTIALMDGDRERACRHTADLVEGAPPGSDGVMASWRSMLARELFYLGRFDEAEPVLREAAKVGFDPGRGRSASSVEALLLARGGELTGRRSSRAPQSRSRRPRRTTSGFTVGATRILRWCSSGRVGSKRRGTPSNARSPSGSGSAACRTSLAPASSSTR